MRKRLAIAILFMASTAFGQTTTNSVWYFSGTGFISSASSPDTAKFLLIYNHQVADTTRSYLINCGTDYPNCNTVYTSKIEYSLFDSPKDALKFIQASGYTFVRLAELKTIPVTVEEKTVVEKHPDTEKKVIEVKLESEETK